MNLTASQKLQLTKYRNILLGHEATIPARREVQAQSEVVQPPEDDEMMTEINITGVGDPGMLENNLLAQLDDISSSFRSIVDTLTALERQYPSAQDQQAAEVEDNAATTPDLISFSSNSGRVSDEIGRESLPVLIQLTQNWHSVASTVLGYCPIDVQMTEEPRGSSKSYHQAPARFSPSESCSLDSFVLELLTHADEAALVSFVETIIKEMNKHSEELTLDAVVRCGELSDALDPKDAPLVVGIRFLRSVIRQLAVHLSRSGLSYVDLRTRLGSRPSPRSGRNGQSDNLEFKRKVR